MHCEWISVNKGRRIHDSSCKNVIILSNSPHIQVIDTGGITIFGGSQSSTVLGILPGIGSRERKAQSLTLEY